MVESRFGRGWMRAGCTAIGVALVVFGSATVHAAGAGSDAGMEGGADGGQSCVDSSSCAPPSPYCHATSHVCVQCLSDRNCPTGEVCELTRGACVGCLSDADCTGSTPYCSKASGACVECLASANCGNFGLVCQDDRCGWCGDGICGPREVLYDLSWPPQPTCAEDCSGLCPT